ncbi:MAG: hypothetical protein Q8M24_23370 [Pseudolabrys sp.]|nr:hypothetical protein [Pseudolabrys sp.]MDP2298394.1 hypothetical protein [Pseudolabrys sp.]
MPEPTPEAWEQIRHDYEHTDRPLAHICDEHAITIPMLRYRMKKWDWTRRKPFVPRQGPAAVEAAQVEQAAAFVPPTPTPTLPLSGGGSSVAAPHLTYAAEGEEGSIVPRLQSAVARVLPAIEATIARLAAGPHHPREMEQAGRTLGALTRALRELTALLAQHRAEPGNDEPPPQQNIDEFRQELSRRLKGIIAARRAAMDQET